MRRAPRPLQLLVVAEIVLVKFKELNGPLHSHANVVLEHEVQKVVAINENDLRLGTTQDEFSGVAVETTGGDEHTLCDTLPRH
jgi:hypothetical protein